MVAIITLSYNQNEYTLKCIDSILQSDNGSFKLILVDNGSAQENYLELKNKLPACNKIILKRIEKNRGYVGGINYGLEEGVKINSDYFLIMNNDTILDKHAISELIKTCKNFGNKAIVTGKVYHYDEPNKLQDIGYTFKSRRRLTFNRIGLNEEDNGQFDEICERDMLDDVFWLFPINLYKEIGGYSPYFWFNAEQADFALRAKKAGYKLVFTPLAKLWHKGSVSIGGRQKNPRLVYWHIQSTLIFRYLHLSKKLFLLAFLSVLKSIIASYIKELYRLTKHKDNHMQYAKAKLLGCSYFCKWFFLRNINTGINPFENQ